MSTMTMPTPRPITRKSTNLTINTTLSAPSAANAKSPLSPAMIYSPVASPRDKDSAVQALLQTYDDVTFDFSPSTTSFPPGSFAARNSVSGSSNTANHNDTNKDVPAITTSSAAAEAAAGPPTLNVPIPSTPLSPSLRVSWYNLVTGTVTDQVHSIAFHPSPTNESDIQEVRDWCVEQANNSSTSPASTTAVTTATAAAATGSSSSGSNHTAEMQGQEIFRFEYGKYSSCEERKGLRVIKQEQK